MGTHLALSTTNILEDWLNYCKQDAASAKAVGSKPAAFVPVSVGDEMDIFFRGLSAVTQLKTNGAVNSNWIEVEPTRKLYNSKRAYGHFDHKHDLYLTTSADVGTPFGTRGHFPVKMVRHGTPPPYPYCTSGGYAMWSM